MPLVNSLKYADFFAHLQMFSEKFALCIVNPTATVGMQGWIYKWFLAKDVYLKNANSMLLNVGLHLFLIAIQFIKHFYYIKQNRS